MPEQKIIKCPFCEEGEINILYTEASYKERVAYAASSKRRIPLLLPAKTEVMTPKCPNCGKTRLEIQRRLKEGKKISVKDAAKRAKESGLPLKF